MPESRTHPDIRKFRTLLSVTQLKYDYPLFLKWHSSSVLVVNAPMGLLWYSAQTKDIIERKVFR